MQRLPAISCGCTMVAISYILYALSALEGIKINTLSPQSTIVVICACGLSICVYTCLVAPCSIRRFGYAVRKEVQIRRMNLLGLVSLFGTSACTWKHVSGWCARSSIKFKGMHIVLILIHIQSLHSKYEADPHLSMPSQG